MRNFFRSLLLCCLIASPLFAAPTNNPSSTRITDAQGTNTVAVANSAPAGTEYGIVVRVAQIGQKTAANSIPVIIASDQSAVPIKGGDVAGSPTAGTVLAVQGITGGSNLNVNLAAQGINVGIKGIDNAGSPTAGTVLAVQGISGGTPMAGNISQVGGSALALGQTTMSASIPVTFASNQSSLAVTTGNHTGIATFVAAPTSITAGATTTITCLGALTASQPTEVFRFAVQGSANSRCTLQYNNNGTPVPYDYCSTSAVNGRCEVKPTPGAFRVASVTVSGTWTAACTNVDAANQEFTCSTDYCTGSGC